MKVPPLRGGTFFITMPLQSEKYIKRRRKRLIVLSVGAFVLLAAAFGAAAGVAHIKQLQVDEVKVTGNNIVPAGDIIALANQKLEGDYLFVFPKKNIFIYPRKQIASEIKGTYARIGDVKVDIDEKNVLSVNVAERKSFALWCQKPGGDCYYMDRTGYVFEHAPQFTGNVYLKYYGGNTNADEPIDTVYLPQAQFDKLIDLSANLEGVIDVLGFNAKPQDEYELFFRNNDGSTATIKFNATVNMAKIPETINTLVAEYKKRNKDVLPTFDYMDLRYGNNLVVKFREDKAEEKKTTDDSPNKTEAKVDERRNVQ